LRVFEQAAMPTRRTVLRSMLATATAAALPRALQAAPIAATRIGEGVTLLTGPGGNVLAVRTGAGLVVVDSGTEDSSAELLAALRALPGGDRIATLFNTHWHLDQIGGNAALRRAGATIVAHEKTRLRLATGYYLPEERRYRPPAELDAQPNESFYTTASTRIGDHAIDYGYLLEAHTDGDAYVFFRDANVVAVGDAVAPQRDPELDWFGGGWLGGRVDSLKELLALGNSATRYVPSYGPVVGRAAVQAEHDMLSMLFDRFLERVRLGESNEDMLAAGIMDRTGRSWQDPAKFVHDAHKGFWAHHNTLSHDIV
jgi:glyoxylase-like metal-dependent hydrolase (beta-lactamase superfamily II)